MNVYDQMAGNKKGRDSRHVEVIKAEKIPDGAHLCCRDRQETDEDTSVSWPVSLKADYNSNLRHVLPEVHDFLEVAGPVPMAGAQLFERREDYFFNGQREEK